VVALDPRNGEILALWSNPSYDPNALASHDFASATDFSELLDAEPSKPRLARSYQDNFAPGSTFKIVTATAGIERGGVTTDEPTYPPRSEYLAGAGQPLSNFGGTTCGGTLFQIVQQSCNTAFAQMGVENAGADAMIDIAGAYGFDQEVPIDLPSPAQSRFPTEFENAEQLLAYSSIGQFDVRATPLQMALVAAAVANDGEIMTPHVMREVRDDQGDTVDEYDPEVWTSPMSSDTAGLLREAMVSVVTDGTASRLADGLDGLEVGGKTGTAQLGTDPPRSHAWIIGFAGPPDETPRVAVAVLVEGQEGASEQTGGRVAAPIAAAVLQQALAPPDRAGQDDGDSNPGG
jgi:peptidoglycan glycosyltransferase